MWIVGIKSLINNGKSELTNELEDVEEDNDQQQDQRNKQNGEVFSFNAGAETVSLETGGSKKAGLELM